MIDGPLKSSILWGIVGGLSFLVLLQGYHLATQQFLAPMAILAITLLVIVSTTVVTHHLRPRLLQSNERP